MIKKIFHASHLVCYISIPHRPAACSLPGRAGLRRTNCRTLPWCPADTWPDKFGRRRPQSGWSGASAHTGEFVLINDVPRICTAAYHPEGNGKLERLHLEMANVSRANGMTPVQSVKFLRTDLKRRMLNEPRYDPANPDEIVVEESKSPTRVFRVGDLVMRNVPRRSRKKVEMCWTGPISVIKVRSDRTYELWSQSGEVVAHVNDLKRYVLPDTDGWKQVEEEWIDVVAEWQLGELLWEQSFADLMQVNWNGKEVFSGFPFKWVSEVLTKLAQDKPVFVVLAIPDIKSMAWYQPLHQMNCHWIEQPRGTVVDVFGKSVGDFPYKIWWVKVYP